MFFARALVQAGGICYNGGMKKHLKCLNRIGALLLALLMSAALFGCGVTLAPTPPDAIDLPVCTPESGDIDAPVFTQAPAATNEAPHSTDAPEEPTPQPTDTPCPVSEDDQYWTKDEVALYIHLYGHLPSNYITKKEAQDLGWSGGSLEPYAPGCSIGGGYFGNYEKLLPAKKGRTYTECDIDTRGKKSRGAKRIVFSNDGLIYYTDDHYESFTLLYGED